MVDQRSNLFAPWARLALATPADSGPPSSASDQHLVLAADGSGSEEKRTVRVGRRRRSEPAGPQGRERADAPRRRRPSGAGGAPPPSGAGGGGSGLGGGAPSPRPTGGGLPAGLLRSPLLLIGLIILLVVFGGGPLGALLFQQDGQDAGEVILDDPAIAPPTDAPTAAPTAAAATSTPRPAAASSSAGSDGQTWLVMLYQDADDKILEKDIYVDLNEAERIGSSERVQIVAQVDRYQAGYQGDGNWASTKRFFVRQDDDLERVSSDEIADLGEANMADGNTLVDFVTWAIQTYPADKHVLILSDHGMGWPGGWSDPTAPRGADRNNPLSSVLGDQLYLNEMDASLDAIRTQTGLEKFEMIGMDACLMGLLEVFSALAPHAHYAVASQETEPALGWAYTSFLAALQANPDADGAELGRQIVESYIQDDQRIVDDEARADFLQQTGGAPLGGLFGLFGGSSSEELARQLAQNITLTAMDLDAMPALMGSVNDLALVLQESNQRAVAQARGYAQSFTSVFGSDVPPSYIDLGSFVQFMTRTTGDTTLMAQAAEQVMNALGEAVIAEKHGSNKPGATGVSIYFPVSQLYRHPAAGAQSYTVVADRFAQESLWDDFLFFHYTGQGFEPASSTRAVPQTDAAFRAPGAGQNTISPITLSSDVARAPSGRGQPVLISADISGDNIGYIKLFVGFLDQASNSIFIADMDYLESPDTREVNGVYYPDWGQGDFTVEFEWEPIVFAISNGSDSAVALFAPQTYGAAPEEATYTVDGVYTYADGESRPARLYFRDGALNHVFGFTGDGETGAPREIIPQANDAFTVMEKWMDLAQDGAMQMATQDGDTLAFSAQTLTWEELDAPAGEYVVGFIVEDLDGNAKAAYAQLRVEQ